MRRPRVAVLGPVGEMLPSRTRPIAMNEMIRPAEHQTGRPNKRGGTGALWRVAGMIAVIFMGSTLVTPLYVLYREVFRFSAITLTLVYAVYVVGNLASLMFLAGSPTRSAGVASRCRRWGWRQSARWHSCSPTAPAGCISAAS